MSSIETLPTKGIYTLIIFLSRRARLNVGKLAMHKFPRGYYTYTGSALGKGATSLKRRVSRHLRKGKRNLWHIDFLLANENATVTAVVAAQTSKKLECNMNRYMKREERHKFLSTDSAPPTARKTVKVTSYILAKKTSNQRSVLFTPSD